MTTYPTCSGAEAGHFVIAPFTRAVRPWCHGLWSVVLRILAQALQHDPGTTHVYSNRGYLVLGLVIEKVSGQN